MNDLQMTLLLVGGGGIIAMIAYNWWQDHRLRKQASERFGDNIEDPLLGGGVQKSRSEPILVSGSLDEPATDEDPRQGDAADPTLANEMAPALDRRLFVDFIIRFDEPQDENCWHALCASFNQINKKRIVYSAGIVPNDSEQDALWFKHSPFKGMANALRASVQLANRKGPLTTIEFSEVLSKLRRFAEDRGGEVEFPEMKDIVSKAETLDQAAAALDTLLGLHCLVADDIPEADLHQALSKAGWVQAGHHWELTDESGPLATMVVHNAPGKRLLSFNIDVPASADPVKSLSEVVTVCHGFNTDYGAPLMDDSGRTLNTQAIEGIYTQLIDRVRNLTDSGFKPGEEVARTLFS